MLLECFIKKTRTDLIFREQAWIRSTAKCWVENFIFPHKHHDPKNVKSISNTTVSLLVSCGVIPMPAIMKGREKQLF